MSWSRPMRWPRSGRPACWDRCTWRSIRRSARRRRGRLEPGATIGAGQVVDLPVDRTDAVVAVGRRQRRRTRPDRRHHPQLQRRAVRAPGQSPRSAHSTRHLRRHAGPTARQHHRHHRGAEPARRHVRRPARRHHPGAATKIPPALDVLIRERPRITTALDKLRRLQRHRDRAGQRHAGRPGEQPAEPRADAPRAGRRRTGSRHRARVRPDVPVQPEPHRPRRPRRLHEPVRRLSISPYPGSSGRLFLGTRWGEEDATLVPAPGEPYYNRYTQDPLRPSGIGAAATASPAARRSSTAAACRHVTAVSARRRINAAPAPVSPDRHGGGG